MMDNAAIFFSCYAFEMVTTKYNENKMFLEQKLLITP